MRSTHTAPPPSASIASRKRITLPPFLSTSLATGSLDKVDGARGLAGSSTPDDDADVGVDDSGGGGGGDDDDDDDELRGMGMPGFGSAWVGREADRGRGSARSHQSSEAKSWPNSGTRLAENRKKKRGGGGGSRGDD
jgi:hypothetical protein